VLHPKITFHFTNGAAVTDCAFHSAQSSIYASAFLREFPSSPIGIFSSGPCERML
jgi:hypothetical protein